MKKIIISFAAALAAVSAAAQDDISKQLEVTKAYAPVVGQADKIAVEPRMSDTVQLRPEIAYSIIPTAWRTSFGTARLHPATMSVTPYEKHRPFYLRAGAGYPLQSTADLYFNPYMGNRSTLGFFFNHRGMFQNIENDMGNSRNSVEMLNGGGLYGSKEMGRRVLEGDVEYDNRVFHPYAEFARDPAWAPGGIEVPNRFAYGRARGKIVFGDTFADPDRFNFRVGLEAAFSHEGRSSNQADINFDALLGRMYRRRHGFEIGLRERGVIGLGELSAHGSSAFIVMPRYLLSAGIFQLRAGIDLGVVNNNAHGQSYFLISYPLVEASVDVAKGRFSPYLRITNRMIDGSFEALSRENPYIAAGKTAPTGWIYDARLGFNGSVNGLFRYNFYAAAALLDNYHAFYNIHAMLSDDRVMFATVADKGAMFSAGGELGLTKLGGFSAALSANWYGYSFNNLPAAAGEMPDFDCGIDLSYSYRDKFTLNAGAKVLGPRGYLYNTGDTDRYLEAGKLKTAVDISVGGEFRISEGFHFFVEASNLANQKLYPYPHYRGLGANVMGGIKLVF